MYEKNLNKWIRKLLELITNAHYNYPSFDWYNNLMIIFSFIKTLNSFQVSYLRYNDVHLTSQFFQGVHKLFWVPMYADPTTIHKNLCGTVNQYIAFYISLSGQTKSTLAWPRLLRKILFI